NDEPATELLKQIKMEKALLVQSGEIKKQLGLPEVSVDEQFFKSPESWVWTRFGEVADFSAGRTPSRHDLSFWNTGEYAWISIADMKDGETIFKTKETISEKAKTQVFSSDPVGAGTIIMSFKLTIGKIARLGIPAFHNEAIISIRPHLSALDEYLFMVLPQFSREGNTKDAIKGATLNRESITNILLPLPPLAEQHRIVAKVDELMVLCDQLQAAQTEREQSRDRLVAASLNKLNQSEQSRRPGRDCRDPDFRDESNTKPTTPATIQAKQPAKIAEAPPGYLPVNWLPAIPRHSLTGAGSAGTTGFDNVYFVLENLPRLTTRPAHIKQLRQTILNLAVRGKLVPQDPNEESADKHLESLRNEKIELIRQGLIRKPRRNEERFEPKTDVSMPIGWGSGCVADFGAAVENAIVDGPFGSNLKISDYDPDGTFPVITISNINEGFELSSLRKVNEKKFTELKRSAVHANDLLVAKIGSSYGKVGIYPPYMPTGIIPANLLKITPNPKMSWQFLIIVLKSPDFKNELENIVQFTAQPAFGVSKFKLLPIFPNNTASSPKSMN
ncbi:restriction endonuclease subunit S, partial [Methylomonas rosea]